MEETKTYCLRDLENCLVRFLYLINELKQAEKGELNDLTISFYELKEELKTILNEVEI